MSLSAKERILKLRETEYKLQKLQNDLLNGNNNSSTVMSDFLSHHKELMALPGSTRDTLPFRFSFQAPKRYVEMQETQKLTLPPKIPAKSVNRLKPYKDSYEMDDLDKNTGSFKFGLAGHRSLALQTLLSELDKQTSKMILAYPKLDKFTLLNKSPFLRSRQPSKISKRFTSSNGTRSSPTQPLAKGLVNNNNKSNTNAQTTLWSKPPVPNLKSKNVSLMWNHEVSENASTATASELLLLNNDDDKSETKSEDLVQHDSDELRESVAYALGTANLMGVILPSNSAHAKRGPNTWGDKKSSGFAPLVGKKDKLLDKNDNDDNLSVKEAVSVLRRRKLPERKSLFQKSPLPHERGLIGVEISNFEPQYAFFYRDRNGNYNPHLHHSKNVTESMKNGKFRWNKRAKQSL